MRRQFRLPSDDHLYLEATGLEWETLVEKGLQWLLIRDRPLARGYTLERAHTALQIAPGYPDAEIDMVYFDPALVRRDGVIVSALASQALDDRTWQRWSRHRTPQNPWRPGIDGVATHLVLVDYWLAREFGRAAA